MSSPFPGGDDVTVRVLLDTTAVASGSRSAVQSIKGIETESGKLGKTLDVAAKKSAQSTEELSSSLRKVGVGFGAIVAASSLAGSAYVSQERQLSTLRRTYGDAADELAAFADKLQQTTTFSNDQARQAEIIFGTLARNYGLTADQIQQLTLRTADLAAATGFSLPDAAERVAAAIRGEAESAEALGLTMNQQAIDRENLTLKMSNQEAAQFRLNALYTQSAFAEGAAAERADTLAGKTQQLVNQGQDLIQWAGGAIGPLGQVTSVLGNIALAAPVVGAGLGEVAGAFRVLGDAEKLARVGTVALDVALGPIGLVAAAFAAGLAIEEFIKRADAANLSVSEVTKTVNDFKEAIAGIGPGAVAEALTGDLDVLSEVARKTQENQAIIQQARADLLSAQTKLAELEQARSGPVDVEADIAAAKAEVEVLKARAEALDANIVSEKQLQQLEKAFLDIRTDVNPLNAQLVADEVERLTSLFRSGAITADDYVAAIVALDKEHKSFGLTLDQLAGREKVATEATGGLQRALKGLPPADTPSLMGRLVDKVKSATEAIDAGTLATNKHSLSNKDQSHALAIATETQKRATEASDQATRQLEEQRRAQAELNHEILTSIPAITAAIVSGADAAAAALQKEIDSVNDFAHALGVFDSFAEQIRPIDLRVRGGDRATGTAAELERTAAGLDSVLGEFRTIEDLGQRQEQAGSIVDKLVGKPGEWATIDDLLKEGRISRTRYNETVEAGIDIQARSVEVQRDLQVIEAKQLPILDAADAAYARYIDRVAHLSPTQQTAALGFLDANEALKAQQAIALAAAAANGELGDQGKEAAQKIIEGAIAADPVLTAMLKELGLVSIDREGNVRIHFPDAKSLHDDLSLIKDDLDALIKLLGGVPPDVKTKVKVETEGKKDAEDTVNLVEGADGKTGHMRVTADTSEADHRIGQAREAAEKPVVVPVSFAISQAPGQSGDPRNIGGASAQPVTAEAIKTPPADTTETEASLDTLAADSSIKGRTAGENAGQGMDDGLRSKQGGIAGAAQDAVAAVAAAGQNAYAYGFNNGIGYDQGFIDAINAGAAAVAAAAANVAGGIPKATADALESHSPSRKAMREGDNWIDGWLLSLARGQADVERAAFSLFDLRAARSVGLTDPSWSRVMDAQRPALPAAPVVVRGGHSIGDVHFDVNVNGSGLDTDAIVQRINTETVDAIYGLINRRL